MGAGDPSCNFAGRSPKIIGHGNTQITEQRPCKAAKALLPWNSEISVVVELHFLSRQDFTTRNAVYIDDVMMRTNEE